MWVFDALIVQRWFLSHIGVAHTNGNGKRFLLSRQCAEGVAIGQKNATVPEELVQAIPVVHHWTLDSSSHVETECYVGLENWIGHGCTLTDSQKREGGVSVPFMVVYASARLRWLQAFRVIQQAQRQHLARVEFHFFRGIPPWVNESVERLVNAFRGVRRSRCEDFGYKYSEHWDWQSFGIRLEVWHSLRKRQWYALKDEWFIAYLPRRVADVPTLNVLPSNVCNARCPYCVSDILGRKSVRVVPMDYARLQVASEFVRRRGGYIANISGGGEPTLSEELPKIVSRLRASFPRVVLHTNGSRLLNVQERGLPLVAILAEQGLSEISLHRIAISDVENFETMRLRERYVIADVVSWCKRLGLRIQLSCVLLKGHVGTEHEVLRFLDWASSLGVDRVVCRELIPRLPVSAKGQGPIEYYRQQRVSLALLQDSHRFPRMVLVRETRWGERGRERLYQYTSPDGKKTEIRFLQGQWDHCAQSSGQVSGFVFRYTQKQWGLYVGWVTKSDRIL